MINKVWHENNKFPKGTNKKIQYFWYDEHMKYCGCRPIPKNIVDDFLIHKFGLDEIYSQY